MKNALIIFPDEWLQFAPSVLNLETTLRETGHQVFVIYGDNGYFKNDKLVDNGIKLRYGYKSSVFKTLRRFSLYAAYKRYVLEDVLRRCRKSRHSFDLVIAVDIAAYIAAKKYFDDVVYFSLELPDTRHKARGTLTELGIDHLIIQSEERYNYFRETLRISARHVHYVQNAPIYSEEMREASWNNLEGRGKRMLYLGNVDRGYGLQVFIDALRALPSEYRLVVKGFSINQSYIDELKYSCKDLMQAGRLQFIFDYIDQQEIVRFVSQYYAGVVGYDTQLVHTDFNYASSPAGKLFNYYAGAIPVIGLDIVGLRSVRDFDTGILLPEITPEAFVKAIRQIDDNYKSYACNCIEAATHFDFAAGIRSFLKAFYQYQVGRISHV